MWYKTNLSALKNLYVKLFRETALVSLALGCTCQIISKYKTKYWSQDCLWGNHVESNQSAARAINHCVHFAVVPHARFWCWIPQNCHSWLEFSPEGSQNQSLLNYKCTHLVQLFWCAGTKTHGRDCGVCLTFYNIPASRYLQALACSVADYGGKPISFLDSEMTFRLSWTGKYLDSSVFSTNISVHFFFFFIPWPLSAFLTIYVLHQKNFLFQSKLEQITVRVSMWQLHTKSTN